MLSGANGALLRLGVALFFAQAAFHIYSASLPLYFASLGFDATLIGLLIGAAGMAELVGALAVGPGIDRFGGRTLLLSGVGCYLVAALGYLTFTAVPVLTLCRLVNGFGLSAVIPSSYSFVPHLARARVQTVAFATLGAAGNVAAAVFPPLGIALLENVGAPALFTAAAIVAALAGAVTLTVPAPRVQRRPLSLVFQRAWLSPLAVAVLSVPQWGVIQAFVPIEAARAGSGPALLFTADAIAVLASRIPAGWIADRYGPFRLALVGVICMTLPPMLAQLSQRSNETNRGTALAYFSVAFAAGMILGASGGGLLYPYLGFDGLLRFGAFLCLLGVLVLIRDRVTMRLPATLSSSAA